LRNYEPFSLREKVAEGRMRGVNLANTFFVILTPLTRRFAPPSPVGRGEIDHG
jgi:hypothetical protein